MSETRPPSIIVFDVNETLLDLTTLEPLFERVFGDGAVMREWFAQLILYCEALTLSGLYVPFEEIAPGALKMVGATWDVPVHDDDVSELKDRTSSMPPLPDVVPALQRLKEAGFRLVTLTNSAPGSSPSPLERAGLAECFERNFSVDEVGRFKPAPETYRFVADNFDCDFPDLCMVACHLWDTVGAQAAGCSAAFVRRPGNAVMPAPGVPVPDIIADDMRQVAKEIIARWGSNLA